MLFVVALVVIGIAATALALGAGAAATIVRVLEGLDACARDPEWWPDFERRFAEYVAAQQAAP